MATSAESNLPKRGSLIIAGSGIASVAHFTLETVSHLENSDKVFYLVNDPVTEAFIQEKNPDTFNLVVFYSEVKERYHSYVEMAEVMLKQVRAGHKVLGIFYGHPGVFVYPSRRALFIARQENYEARMLPGISSEDYMFADLELDPAEFGSMTCEANELIARNRPLNTSVHNIIWQAGIVGVSTAEYQESKFQLLVDRLERDFGPEHKVVHYVGAIRMTPQAQSAMVVYSIQELRNTEVARFINSASTLYVPPREIAPVDSASAAELGLSQEAKGFLAATPTWVGSRFVTPSSYGELEKRIIAQMNEASPNEAGITTYPERPGHRPDDPSSHGSEATETTHAMKRFMIDLTRNPRLQEEYKKDPAKVAANTPDLRDIERRALSYGLDNTIRKVMSHRGPAPGPTVEQLEEISWEGSTIMHETASSIVH